MKKIDISTKKYPNIFAIVDDEDFDWLNQWKWSTNSIGYAVRFKYVGRVSGKPKYKSIYMHREVNHTPEGLQTDHIDRNKLNNQKSNLRAVTRSQNGRNKDVDSKNTSGYRGVSWYGRTRQWRARISVNKKEFSLGYFRSKEEANLAIKRAQKVFFNI